MNINSNNGKKVDWTCCKKCNNCECGGSKTSNDARDIGLHEVIPVVAFQMNAHKDNNIENINFKSPEKYLFTCSYCNEDLKNVSETDDKLGCPKCKAKFNPEK